MEKRFAHSAVHNPQRTEATEMSWTGSETNRAIRCPCDRNLQHRALTKILSTVLQCGKFLKLLLLARESLRHHQGSHYGWLRGIPECLLTGPLQLCLLNSLRKQIAFLAVRYTLAEVLTSAFIPPEQCLPGHPVVSEQR